MNNSGKSVGALANFFKIEPPEILIAYDELDIPVGSARFKFDGGHGGHNGLRDIIPRLGNRKDFHRLRIGISHPGSASKVSGYVLSKAPEADRAATDDTIVENEGIPEDAGRLHRLQRQERVLRHRCK